MIGDMLLGGEPGEAVAPVAPGSSVALNPPIGVVGTVANPVQGIIRDWGGMFYNVKATQNPGGAAQGGAAGDDTLPLQGAMTAALVASAGDDAFGAVAYMPPDTYRASSLTYNGKGMTLRGAGMRSTCVRQLTATATFMIAPAGGATFPCQGLLFEDFNIELWNNSSSLGGIDLRGAMRSTCRRVFVDGAPAGADGIRIAGQGTAASGDAMFCTVEECEFNPQNAVSTCIHLVSAASGGSHPDAARILNNYCNGNANTTFLKIDAVAAVGGYFGVGNPVIAFNRVEGAGTLYDIAAVGAEIYGGWHEVTTGTMALTIQAGPANFPTRDTKIFGGVYATYGDPTKFLVTDGGINTEWFGAGQKGTVHGLTATTLNGTATLDPGLSVEWLCTLAGNTTIVLPNAIKGQRQIFKITHDGTGTAYTITWPANVKLAGGAFGTNKAGTNTAGSVDMLVLDFDGTNWNEYSRALNLS